MFVFELTTKKDYFPNLGILCDENGHVLGRVISRYKLDIPENATLYTYDIESTKDTYENLLKKNIQLYRIEDFTVSPCTTYYIRK